MLRVTWSCFFGRACMLQLTSKFYACSSPEGLFHEIRIFASIHYVQKIEFWRVWVRDQLTTSYVWKMILQEISNTGWFSEPARLTNQSKVRTVRPRFKLRTEARSIVICDLKYPPQSSFHPIVSNWTTPHFLFHEAAATIRALSASHTSKQKTQGMKMEGGFTFMRSCVGAHVTYKDVETHIFWYSFGGPVSWTASRLRLVWSANRFKFQFW